MSGRSKRNGLPYYKRYPRDFFEGTIGMSFELKGCYSLVLDLIYMQNGALPDDPRYISGLLGCSVRAWNKWRGELIAMGRISSENGIISNFRADKELESLRSFQDNQSKKASIPRKNNDLASAAAKPGLSHTESEPESIKRDTNVSPKKRASRLPDDWELPEDYRAWCHQEWPGIRDPFITSQSDRFRDYWTGKAGKDAAKVSWLATWRNWMRRAVEDAGKKRGIVQHQEPKGGDVFFAAAEFLRNEQGAASRGGTNDWQDDESFPLLISDYGGDR